MYITKEKTNSFQIDESQII